MVGVTWVGYSIVYLASVIVCGAYIPDHRENMRQGGGSCLPQDVVKGRRVCDGNGVESLGWTPGELGGGWPDLPADQREGMWKFPQQLWSVPSSNSFHKVEVHAGNGVDIVSMGAGFMAAPMLEARKELVG